MLILALLLAVVVPYFMGSIPTGYLIVKMIKKIDVRTIGSGNIGATNVKRVLGTKWFFVVLTLDALKGFIPVSILTAMFGGQYEFVPVLAGAAAVLGHTFTIFLNFKGGKGVATALGVLLALAPLSAFCCILVFIMVVWMFGYISLGSIVAAALLPVFVIIFSEMGFLGLIMIFSLAAAVFVIYKHTDNIKRLLAGTENKFDLRGGIIKQEEGKSVKPKKGDTK
jgi:glycerol-3-phosphate acyltransferase PlsY